MFDESRRLLRYFTAARELASTVLESAERNVATRTGCFDHNVTWILGSPRSGSTWLWLMLREFDGVVAINEPHIGGFLSPFLCDLPGSSVDGQSSENFTIRLLQRSSTDQFFNDEFKSIWLKGLSEMIRARLTAQVQRYPSAMSIGKTHVVVKEPNGSQSADVIMAAMPKAKLLFLLRDGRDVVDSELAANLNGAWASRQFPGVGLVDERSREEFVIQSAFKWLWRTEVVEEAFRVHQGPRLLIRYEELLGNPHSELRRILDWMELAVPEDQLTAVISKHGFESIPESERGEGEFFRAASPGKWRENLFPAEQAALDHIIGHKLEQLGYMS